MTRMTRMPDEWSTNIRVSGSVKRRLEELQREAHVRVGRYVTISQVLEELIAEHDKTREANPA